jgi:biopolymer transport protein ExbD
MSDDPKIQDAEVVDVKEEQSAQQAQSQEQQPLEIEVDAQTAFQIKLQEFDKNIATGEAQVADLKKQKMEYIYNYNVQMITEQHKQKLIQQQVQEELANRNKPKKV